MTSKPTGKIRVLMVIPGTNTGASMVFVRRQVVSLDPEQFEIESFFLEDRVSSMGLLAEGRRLRRIIKDFSPDIVHAHYGTATGFLTVMVSPVETVLHLRGSDIIAPQPGLRSRVGRFLSQFAALRATTIVCVSEHLKESLWWAQDKVVVFPDGIDINLFTPQDRSEARSHLGWADSVPVVIFNAGRDPFVKRLALAEKVMEQVRKDIPEVQFEVLTGGHAPESIPKMFNAADCLLVTSLSEGSPNVVKEAMACNLPVVSVPVGDVVQRLKGVTPSVVVPDHPDALAVEVVAILKERERSNGREKVGELSLENISTRLAEVYLHTAGA